MKHLIRFDVVRWMCLLTFGRLKNLIQLTARQCMVTILCALPAFTAARAQHSVFYRFPRSTCLNFLGNPAFTVSVGTLILIHLATHVCRFREATLEFCRNRQ